MKWVDQLLRVNSCQPLPGLNSLANSQLVKRGENDYTPEDTVNQGVVSPNRGENALDLVWTEINFDQISVE